MENLGDAEDSIGGALYEVAKEEIVKLVLGPLFPFAKRASEGFAKRKQRDLAYFLRELARRAEDEGADFQREFLEHAFPEKGTGEVITQALKAALDVTDSRILAALAHLAFHYQTNGLTIDLFFRGLVRLFESIGATEFEALQTILGSALRLIEHKKDDPIGLIGVRRGSPGGGSGTQIELFPGLVTTVPVDLTPALKNLLIANGIADSSSPPRSWSGELRFGDETDLTWDVATVVRLALFILTPARTDPPA